MKRQIKEELEQEMRMVTVPQKLQDKTLARIREEGRGMDRRAGRGRRRSGIPAIVAAALVGMLIGVGVLAATYRAGIFDFFTLIGHELTEDEKEAAIGYIQETPADILIQAPVPVEEEEEVQEKESVSENAEISFHVQVIDQYYDGQTLMATINIKPVEEPVGFTSTDCRVTDSLFNLTLEKEDMDISLLDHYLQKGYTRCFHARAILLENHTNGMEHLEEDGSLTYLLRHTYEEMLEQRDATIRVTLTPYYLTLPELKEKGTDDRLPVHQEEKIIVDIPLQLHADMEAVETMVLSEKLDFASAGVEVETITMIRKPTELSYAVDYRVTDPELFADTAADIEYPSLPMEPKEGERIISMRETGAIDFEFIDPDIEMTGSGVNQRLPEGISSSKGIKDLGDGRFRVFGTIAANAIPEDGVYTLRAFSYETKKRYESYTIKMGE